MTLWSIFLVWISWKENVYLNTGIVLEKKGFSQVLTTGTTELNPSGSELLG